MKWDPIKNIASKIIKKHLTIAIPEEALFQLLQTHYSTSLEIAKNHGLNQDEDLPYNIAITFLVYLEKYCLQFKGTTYNKAHLNKLIISILLLVLKVGNDQAIFNGEWPVYDKNYLWSIVATNLELTWTNIASHKESIANYFELKKESFSDKIPIFEQEWINGGNRDAILRMLIRTACENQPDKETIVILNNWEKELLTILNWNASIKDDDIRNIRDSYDVQEQLSVEFDKQRASKIKLTYKRPEPTIKLSKQDIELYDNAMQNPNQSAVDLGYDIYVNFVLEINEIVCRFYSEKQLEFVTLVINIADLTPNEIELVKKTMSQSDNDSSASKVSESFTKLIKQHIKFEEHQISSNAPWEKERSWEEWMQFQTEELDDFSSMLKSNSDPNDQRQTPTFFSNKSVITTNKENILQQIEKLNEDIKKLQKKLTPQKNYDPRFSNNKNIAPESDIESRIRKRETLISQLKLSLDLPDEEQKAQPQGTISVAQKAPKNPAL